MIGELDTFIQFFAAIYVTITLDNLLCKRFWSPDFYKMVVDSINSYQFQKSSNIQGKLDFSIKRKAHELEETSRKRGAFMLISCVLLLIYSGFENDLNGYVNVTQSSAINFPIFMFLFCMFIGIILHLKIFFKWSYVILFSIFSIIISLLSFFIIGNLPKFQFLGILNYIKFCVVFLLLVPVIHQIYINWLYSSVYMFHLKRGLSEEYALYKRAKEALDKNREDIVPDEYKSVFSSLFFQNDKKEDMQVTKIVNCLCERLENTCKPSSSWDLLKVYFLKRKDIRIDNIDDNDKLPDENLPVMPNNELMEKACEKYKSLSPKPKMVVFCADCNISYEEFRIFCKEKNINKKLSQQVVNK